MTNKHGGKRIGSGNKTGSKRVTEKRKAVSLYVKPSILTGFKNLFGNFWGRAIEDHMQDYVRENTRQE